MPTDPHRRFADSVVRRLRDAGFRALLAGGCVRDLRLGRTPKDYDVATDARPDAVRALFGHGRTLAVGVSFGVVKVIPSKAERERGVEPVEVATFRTEGPYLDGRRPESVSFATPEEDAKRRDFTINGMFLDPIDDRLLDYVGGEADLAAGVVRAIGDPRARMAEDKLRLLRAVRFAATLAFRLDDATAAAVREMADQLVVVSAERIAQELRRMLAHRHRRHAVELSADCGLLEVMFPELAPALRLADTSPDSAWQRTLRALDALDVSTFEPPLAALLLQASGGRQPPEQPHAISPPDSRGADAPRSPSEVHSVAAACRRLRLSNAETDRVLWLTEHRRDLDEIATMPLSRLKRLAAHPAALDLARLVRAERLAEGRETHDPDFLERFLAETPREVIDPPPLLTGGDLVALGLKPGPAFKRLLDAVRDAQLDGAITTRDEALTLARTLQATNPNATNNPP